MVFNRQKRLRNIVQTAALAYFAFHSGCLNPAFVNKVSGGSVVPLAPGDTPYIHLLLINATIEKTIDVQFAWTPEYQGFNTGFLDGVPPGGQHGFVLGCPINQVGLGDPTDLTVPALTVVDTAQTIEVPASAFPLTLKNGTDFVCGDTIVFTITDDRNNGYGINISPGRVDGSMQGGPFSGPDTFAVLQVLQFSGNIPTPIP